MNRSFNDPEPKAVKPAPAAPILQPATYADILTKLLSEKWQMVSEGPSGAQLKKPKTMKVLDQLCAAAGVILLFFAWSLGLLLIVIALIDLAFLTKEKTHFLSRDRPTLPP